MANSMEGIAWSDTRVKVQKWIEDGQYLVGLIPALVEENERLRTWKVARRSSTACARKWRRSAARARATAPSARTWPTR